MRCVCGGGLGFWNSGEEWSGEFLDIGRRELRSRVVELRQPGGCICGCGGLERRGGIEIAGANFLWLDRGENRPFWMR